jgi:hypothetical protein
MDKTRVRYAREMLRELYKPSEPLETLPVELLVQEGPASSSEFTHSLGPNVHPKRCKQPVPLSPCSPCQPLHLPCDLLLSRAASGDPFAQILLEHGEIQAELVLIHPFTRPLERVWYWEDLRGGCEGPLSAVDMFHWNLGGWLERRVRVTWSGKDAFVPLDDLIEWQRNRTSVFHTH